MGGTTSSRSKLKIRIFGELEYFGNNRIDFSWNFYGVIVLPIEHEQSHRSELCFCEGQEEGRSVGF